MSLALALPSPGVPQHLLFQLPGLLPPQEHLVPGLLVGVGHQRVPVVGSQLGRDPKERRQVKIPQERERKVTAPFFLEMDETATSGQSRSRQARGSSLVCHHGMPDPDPPWPSKG